MMFFQKVKGSSRAGKACLLVAKCLSTCKTNKNKQEKDYMNISNKTTNTLNILKNPNISKEHWKPKFSSRNPSTKFSSHRTSAGPEFTDASATPTMPLTETANWASPPRYVVSLPSWVKRQTSLWLKLTSYVHTPRTYMCIWIYLYYIYNYITYITM